MAITQIVVHIGLIFSNHKDTLLCNHRNAPSLHPSIHLLSGSGPNSPRWSSVLRTGKRGRTQSVKGASGLSDSTGVTPFKVAPPQPVGLPKEHTTNTLTSRRHKMCGIFAILGSKEDTDTLRKKALALSKRYVNI